MKLVLLPGLLFLGLTLLILYSTRPNLEEELTEQSALEREQPIELTQSSLDDYKGEKLLLNLRFDKGLIFEEQEVSFFYNIYATIYSEEEGESPTLVRSQLADALAKSKLVTLRGDVKVNFPRNRLLTTEKLIFDQERELLYNQEEVKLVSKNDEVKAKSMEYDLKAGLLKLKEPRITLFEF